MADTVTEVTTQSWGSRISESIKGVLFGLLLFLVSFVVLFWNEGRAVKTAKTLAEGAAAVVNISADSADAANNGKLVHLSGDARTEQVLRDTEFGVSANAIQLRRGVQMYQWVEHSETKTEKQMGGSEKKTTTYTYRTEWADHAIDSSRFKEPAGHQNPGSMPVEPARLVAGNVTVGAFTLPGSLIARIDNWQPLPPPSTTQPEAVPLPMQGRAQVRGGEFYLPASPTTQPGIAAPVVGDTRVAFSTVSPGPVSIVSRQNGKTFEPYTASTGKTIDLLSVGTLSAQAMFAEEMAANERLTWLLRLGGFVLMFVGLAMVFRPLSVVADVVPLIGNIVGMGTAAAAGLIALVLSLATIAVAWLAYRPLWGATILAGAIALLVLAIRRRKKAASPA